VLYEQALVDDPEGVGIMFDAFNRWLEEDWGFAYRDRIFATPMIPFGDPGRAVELIDWAIGRGARAVAVAAAPALTASGFRSPADGMFDPFWARCAEAGVIVCAHAGANHYNRYSGDWTGHHEQRPFEDQTLDSLMNHGRPVSDYLAALVWQGTLTRFPNLRVMSVENRSEWAVPLLKAFRRFYRPGALAEDPVETFHRCVWISPHWEDELEELVEQVLPERVVAGSDWPHYDSLAEPASFAKCLEGFSDEAVRRIMRDNLRSLVLSA
jgi:predicted TIM-barrel fold metal-dependent hydrolase